VNNTRDRICWARWCTPIIPTLQKLGQEAGEFEASGDPASRKGRVEERSKNGGGHHCRTEGAMMLLYPTGSCPPG
jgi:hypothetical protein